MKTPSKLTEHPRIKELNELIQACDSFNKKTNTKLTLHQIKVLSCCIQIPEGSFSTYGAIARALKSSPRAVGQALRNNPFAPTVPCHRVITSDYKIGGFDGQWGSGTKIQAKKELLTKEGLVFNEKLKTKLFINFEV
ncbi:DNA binding methylated-DNA--cysteine S-methyltransferase [Neoconidiobolus thromboides FSU 785]|nr:DNA binding methylated-DNA--cysteine S-methyltransferase [Neoconidiobolus thromboides FSU 785]